MCDNALLSGFALDQRRVDRELVEEVARDFDLDPRGKLSHTAGIGRRRL